MNAFQCSGARYLHGRIYLILSESDACQFTRVDLRDVRSHIVPGSVNYASIDLHEGPDPPRIPANARRTGKTEESEIQRIGKKLCVVC